MQARAVTLVAPGLNVRPLAMMPLIKVLNDLGSDACLVHFSTLSPKWVSADVLERDFMEGYDMAQSIANNKGVPLYFLGFSLGVLLAHYHISLKPGTHFEKQILIAPATAIKLPQALKSFIGLLNDNLRVPSYTPGSYSLEKWLPAKIYKRMMYWERSILRSSFAQLNIPTLIILDPKDELISYSRIRKQINKYDLTNYKCIVLDSDLKLRATKYHHLVIDEATMGKTNWYAVVNRIKAFLDHSE